MEKIAIEAIINEPVEKVWDAYTKPEHITKWNFADDSWHCPRAENDLRPDGRFSSRMEAKDGSEGFDFEGVYDEVEPYRKIAYHMSDGRTVMTEFEQLGNSTHVKTVFDPENENTPEMQKQGWQAILNTFKKYVEHN